MAQVRGPGAEGRLEAVRATGLVHARHPGLQRITDAVAAALDAPVALVSLVTDTEQVFPAQVGLPHPWQDGTPLSHSFCQHVVLSGEPLVVVDARVDPRVQDNLAVQDLDVIGYAGVPLRASNGELLGSLCAIDHQPRQWTEQDLAVLTALAEAAGAQIELATQMAYVTAVREQAGEAARQLDLLSAVGPRMAEVLEVEESLAGLADLLVPELADLVSVDLVDDGDPTATRSVVVRAVDPAQAATLAAADRLAPRRTNPRSVVHHVLTTGEARLVPAVDPAYLRARAASDDQLTAWLELDIRTALAVPLLARGRMIGVLTMLRLGPDAVAYEESDLRFSRELGRRAGLHIDNARLYAAQRQMAETLQRSLLPDELPSLPGVELAARYEPSAENHLIGGDWYDAFPLPGGSIGLAVGDVMGHDLVAAAAMGQLRSVLRSYASRAEEPGRVLDELDRLVSIFRMAQLATVFYARLDLLPAGGARLTWANAGHPPPLLLHADGTAEFLSYADAPPVGALRGAGHGEHAVDVPAGSVLLLYTDGLVERRDADIDTSLQTLLSYVRQDRVRSLGMPELCAELVRPAQAGPRPDDVAVLAVRILPR